MILGITTGLKNFQEGQSTIVGAGATMSEIWFDVTKAEEFKPMFQWLLKHNIAIGLHHWGVIDTNIKTNLATQDTHVRDETIRQIKQTIDIGSEIGCVYVTMHPGAGSIETVNYTNWQQELVKGRDTPNDVARKLFLEAAQELAVYAESKHVLLTIESTSERELKSFEDRSDIYNAHNIHLDAIEEATKSGAWFANDIAHTSTHLFLQHKDEEKVMQELLQFSARMEPRTRLIHMNLMSPPFNGTDSHDGITELDFIEGTFPNKRGVIDFLTIYKNRDDIFVVNEPKGEVAGNFVALQALARCL